MAHSAQHLLQTDNLKLYRCLDAKRILKNKHIVIIGDSVQRGVYKDLVVLLQQDRLLTEEELKAKGEPSHCNDVLAYRTELSNSKDYTEVRDFQSDDGCHLVQYYFVTRCYNERVEAILQLFRNKEMPDIIIMNSCLWDISRYGPPEICDDAYKANMRILLAKLRKILPPHVMFIWTTTMPVSSHIGAGFLLENVQFLQDTLRLAILEANYFNSQLVTEHGFDVLDLNFYMRPQIALREPDGVHWKAPAHRHITDLLLTFLLDSWGRPLPRHLINQFKDVDLNFNFSHFRYDETMPMYVARQRDRLSAIAHAVCDDIQGDSDYSESDVDVGDDEMRSADGAFTNADTTPNSSILDRENVTPVCKELGT